MTFSIKILPVSVPFGDEWIEVGGVSHSLYFVRNGFMCGDLCESDCRLVGVRSIYAPTMWDEVYPSSKDDG